jgi:hypothetical protein
MYEGGVFKHTTDHTLFISALTINEDDTFTLNLKGYEYALNKIAVRISTLPSANNIFKFLKQYIMYYMLKNTSMSKIIMTEQDYNTLNNSNIGTYRSNPVSLQYILENLAKNYYINFLSKSGFMVCSFGNTVFSPAYFNNITPFSGGNVTDNYTNLYSFLTTTEAKVARNFSSETPVLVRGTSTNSALGIVRSKSDKKEVAEVQYGDIEALAGGNIINLKLNFLTQETLLEYCKKSYIKAKYLNNSNSFVFKEPVQLKTIIFYKDLKESYPIGFYYITKVKHSLAFDSGYECSAVTGVRFYTLDNLNEYLIK